MRDDLKRLIEIWRENALQEWGDSGLTLEQAASELERYLDTGDLPRVLLHYEIRDIELFRRVEPRFRHVLQSEIRDLYSLWGVETYGAGWIAANERTARKFAEWAFTAPIDKYAPKITMRVRKPKKYEIGS